MSLEGIEKNLDKISKLGRQYAPLLKEKKELLEKIEDFKKEYSGGKFDRDIFSEHNKRLVEIKDSIMKIKEKVRIFSGNIRKEADEEIKNAR